VVYRLDRGDGRERRGRHTMSIVSSAALPTTRAPSGLCGGDAVGVAMFLRQKTKELIDRRWDECARRRPLPGAKMPWIPVSTHPAWMGP
jgi:hypothetical protein